MYRRSREVYSRSKNILSQKMVHFVKKDTIIGLYSRYHIFLNAHAQRDIICKAQVDELSNLHREARIAHQCKSKED